MKRFIQAEGRKQSTLLPELLEDYIAEDNPVRVIDAFIDELDLGKLGFQVKPAVTGRPSYHPSTMLQIYVYGYLNRIQSSRRLERETGRNVELMWLTGRLTPDFKTIAEFRRKNGKAIRKVCRQFVMLCKEMKLFSDALVAIDGSKFKAVNNRDRNFTRNKLKLRLAQIDESLDRYFKQLERADRDESPLADANKERMEDKIAKVKAEVKRLKEIESQLEEEPDQQVSLTDPDARSMATRGRGSGIVGYNVQTAVDAKHHLIVAHEVTNQGHDRSQLANMAKQAQAAIDTQDLAVVADRGYYSSKEILACDEAGITVTLPNSATSNNQAKGLFGRTDFHYIEKDDEYRCPAGERLIWRTTTEEKGLTLHRYWTSECEACDFKAQCTTGKQRRITRWEHEELLETVQMRLACKPELMKTRRATVEHPFGTIKSWMGSTHFQMRELENVSTEMSLHVLAYNMKRVMQIVGIKPLLEIIRELGSTLCGKLACLALSRRLQSQFSALEKYDLKIRLVCNEGLRGLRMRIMPSSA